MRGVQNFRPAPAYPALRQKLELNLPLSARPFETRDEHAGSLLISLILVPAAAQRLAFRGGIPVRNRTKIQNRAGDRKAQSPCGDPCVDAQAIQIRNSKK